MATPNAGRSPRRTKRSSSAGSNLPFSTVESPIMRNISNSIAVLRKFSIFNSQFSIFNNRKHDGPPLPSPLLPQREEREKIRGLAVPNSMAVLRKFSIFNFQFSIFNNRKHDGPP